MNEVKILGDNINIAARENFESGNVLLNFNRCEVSVLSFLLSSFFLVKFVRLFKKQSKDL